MLLIGLAWNPRARLGGLNVFFSRYLFSIGLPVEKWLQVLAELLRSSKRARRASWPRRSRAARACRRSPASPGAAGDGIGRAGRAHAADLVEYENSASSRSPIYSRYRLSPALHWHLHLLGQLLGEFYVAKLREEKLRQTSYLQAVHETGARMTHDIKNLLQSLNVLVSVGARGGRAATHPSCRRWCAASSRRSRSAWRETLEKLQRPQADGGETFVAAPAWWEGARAPVPRRGRRVRSPAAPAPRRATAALALRQRR